MIERLVKRLRWVMLCAMLFSIANTLAGQPSRYWQHPGAAIRGDGLSIYDATNHTFQFLLGHGAAAYLVASLAYVAAAFVAASALPGRWALIVTFSVIFGHLFGAANWIAVRWQLGIQGVSEYGAVLGIAVAAALWPPLGGGSPSTDRVVMRLRWLMVGAMLFDFGCTLLGQPSSFWLHPETFHEGNQLMRAVLAQGWWAYALLDFALMFGAFVLVSSLPTPLGLASAFAILFNAFVGGSNWLFYEWRLGMESPVIYGIVLSTLIVEWTLARLAPRADVPVILAS